MESKIKYLSDVEEFKDFINYAVDTEGNVWSFKHNKSKILSPGWKKKEYGYKAVFLMNRYGKKKTFLVHRLIAITFIPTTDITLKVNHKNGNLSDNRLENLEWVNRETKHLGTTSGFAINESILDKIKAVHYASIIKGLPIPDAHSFTNNILENALEQYINQYGLRKIMR